MTLQTRFTTRNLSQDHPITAGIDTEVAFFGARSVETDTSSADLQVTPLVFSDAEFYGETETQIYEADYGGEYDEDADIPPGMLALAAAFENPVSGTRVVVIGDREFATNGGGLQSSPSYSMSFLYPGNAHFLLNAITWLLDAEQSQIAFPTPAPTGTASPTFSD
jgi:hypothetical protein